jgi:hypothetical protein
MKHRDGDGWIRLFRTKTDLNAIDLCPEHSIMVLNTVIDGDKKDDTIPDLLFKAALAARAEVSKWVTADSELADAVYKAVCNLKL